MVGKEPMAETVFMNVPLCCGTATWMPWSSLSLSSFRGYVKEPPSTVTEIIVFITSQINLAILLIILRKGWRWFAWPGQALTRLAEGSLSQMPTTFACIKRFQLNCKKAGFRCFVNLAAQTPRRARTAGCQGTRMSPGRFGRSAFFLASALAD